MAPNEVDEATQVLSDYVGKTLRVHTNDNRIFVGQMKCTDRVSEHRRLRGDFILPCSPRVQECNVILALTQEYRPPAEDVVKAAAEKAGSSSLQMPFAHRFVGLVVVPGKYITRIEMEEFLAT